MNLRDFYTILAKGIFDWGIILIFLLALVALITSVIPSSEVVENDKSNIVTGLTNCVVGGNSDGKELFKANCASCHKINKESTGPALQGAKQRWKDANEESLIYYFIEDSEALIYSDSSKRAIQVYKDYGEAYFHTFKELSNEDVDAILDFCNFYVKY